VGVALDDDEDDNADFDSEKFHDANTNFAPSPKKKEVDFCSQANMRSFFHDDDLVEINHIRNKDILLPHFTVHWKDMHLYNRCTLFVWCPSGLEPKDVDAKVTSGGRSVKISFPWPDQLQDALMLTRESYCRDSSKIVEMETIFKRLKNGTSNSVISSEVEFDLGMQVEEEFHNEIIGPGRLEKGNKLLRFFKRIQRRTGTTEKIPIVVCKFEMIGVRDNYKTDDAVDSDYDDGEEEEGIYKERLPVAHNRNKKRKSPTAAATRKPREDMEMKNAFSTADAVFKSNLAAVNAEEEAARAAAQVAALGPTKTPISIDDRHAENLKTSGISATGAASFFKKHGITS